MPKFSLSFSIDDAALPILDKLRDGMTRQQFFHHALQLGLCEIFESMTRTHRDMTMHLLTGTTLDYKQGRAALFRTNDPDNADKPAAPEIDERK
jgi:hypothetical protein